MKLKRRGNKFIELITRILKGIQRNKNFVIKYLGETHE